MISQMFCKGDYFWLICQENSDVIVIGRENQQIISALPTDDEAKALIAMDDFIWSTAGSCVHAWDIDSFELLMKLDSAHTDPIFAVIPTEESHFATVSPHAINIWKYRYSKPTQ